MGNPRTTAIVSAIAIVLIGANMLLNNGEARARRSLSSSGFSSAPR